MLKPRRCVPDRLHRAAFVFTNVATAVPEPATWAFLMLGVGAIGVAMRSRRKAGLALAAV